MIQIKDFINNTYKEQLHVYLLLHENCQETVSYTEGKTDRRTDRQFDRQTDEQTDMCTACVQKMTCFQTPIPHFFAELL